MESRPFDPRTGEWLSDRPTWDPELPRRGPAATAWTVVLAADLALLGAVLALGTVGALADSARAAAPTPAGLAVAAVTLLALAGAVPFAWVVATRQGGLHGAVHYLRLERPWPALGWGVLVGLAALVGVLLLGVALYALGYRPENPVVQGIAAVMTLPLALLLAGSAAVAEELLFRGLLLRWLGLWGQAALFGLAHLSYGTPLQVAVPFALGLLFGFLVQRGARLWLCIAAHFTFDFVTFLLAMYGG